MDRHERSARLAMSGMTGGLRELRNRNRLRIIKALRTRLDLSQADISRMTGLSRTTVSTIVRDLIEEGVVEECNRLRSRRQGGRPGIGLRLKPGAWVRPFNDSIANALRNIQGQITSGLQVRSVLNRIWYR
jgi:DNA-binding Lrp family transcriptional regulator